MNLILKHRLMGEEGFRGTPYLDQFGNMTIGYGWAVNKRPMSEELGQIILEYQINEVEKDVLALNSIASWYLLLSPVRQSVILDLAFNMGLNGFLGFKNMIAKSQAGDFAGASDEMLNSAWAKQVPNRAKALSDLFRNG